MEAIERAASPNRNTFEADLAVHPWWNVSGVWHTKLSRGHKRCVRDSWAAAAAAAQEERDVYRCLKKAAKVQTQLKVRHGVSYLTAPLDGLLGQNRLRASYVAGPQTPQQERLRLARSQRRAHPSDAGLLGVAQRGVLLILGLSGLLVGSIVGGTLRAATGIVRPRSARASMGQGGFYGAQAATVGGRVPLLLLNQVLAMPSAGLKALGDGFSNAIALVTAPRHARRATKRLMQGR